MKLEFITIIFCFAVLSAPCLACDDVYTCFLEVAKSHKMTMDSGEPFDKPNIDKCLKERTAIKDISNGYLKMECDALTHGVETALFLGASKRKYLVVTKLGGSVCQSSVYCLDSRNRWVDVSKERLPKLTRKYIANRYADRFGRFKLHGKYVRFTPKTVDMVAHSAVCYRLPRWGTVINAVSYWDIPEYYNKVLFQLRWDKASEGFRLSQL